MNLSFKYNTSDSDNGLIAYHPHNSGANSFIRFTQTGSFNDSSGNIDKNPWSETDEEKMTNGGANIQSYIDKKYVPNSSDGGGSSSSGSVNDNSITTNPKLKEYIESFSNLGFDLPDMIIAKDHVDRMTVRYLQFADDGGDEWNFLYRTLYTGSYDYMIRFKNEVDGPVQSATLTHTDFSDKNLKWYVDNGYAVYLGGGSSSSSNGSSTFASLTDTPSELSGKYIKVNDADGIEFVDAPSSGSASSLQVIKDKSNFYTDLPDAIMWAHLR